MKDLTFVAHLGDAALAGVIAAGNVMFITFALTQVMLVIGYLIASPYMRAVGGAAAALEAC